MRPFATGGAYLNFTPEDRVRDAYGPAKYERLVALKDEWDPTNVFRSNHNIAPSGWTEPAVAGQAAR
jgi:FAD/FMN-containing dehydrogenase